MEKLLLRLEQDPFSPPLHSHKVHTRLFGEVWSSRVTGNLRILWRFHDERVEVLELLDLGGHSGKDSVY